MMIGVADPAEALRSALSVTIVPPSAFRSTCWPTRQRTSPPPKGPTLLVSRLNGVPVLAPLTSVRTERTQL
jgi:hypothetical protein